MNKYELALSNFITEARKLPDVENTRYSLSQEFGNVVFLSGEIIGSDTEIRLREIGEKYGLLALADDLTVLYR